MNMNSMFEGIFNFGKLAPLSLPLKLMMISLIVIVLAIATINIIATPVAFYFPIKWDNNNNMKKRERQKKN